MLRRAEPTCCALDKDADRAFAGVEAQTRGLTA